MSGQIHTLRDIAAHISAHRAGSIGDELSSRMSRPDPVTDMAETLSDTIVTLTALRIALDGLTGTIELASLLTEDATTNT